MKAYGEAVKGDVLEMNIRILEIRYLSVIKINRPVPRPIFITRPAQPDRLL